MMKNNRKIYRHENIVSFPMHEEERREDRILNDIRYHIHNIYILLGVLCATLLTLGICLAAW